MRQLKSLAKSYPRKAMGRLDVLGLLFKKVAYSDVIREAQEIVELSLIVDSAKRLMQG